MATVSSSLVIETSKGYILCYEERRDFSSQEKSYVVQGHILGGKINIGEDSKAAAAREFVEETFPKKLIGTFSGKKFFNEIIRVLSRADAEEIIIKQSEKHNNPIYIVNIEQFNDVDKKVYNPKVYNYLLNLVDEFEPKGTVKSLFYWIFGEVDINNPSYLLQLFITEISKRYRTEEGDEDSVHSGVNEELELNITSLEDVQNSVSGIQLSNDSDDKDVEDEFNADDF